MAQIERIPLEQIVATSVREGEGENFAQLKDSIRIMGVLQPPMVVRDPDGKYLPVFGRRRIAAARALGLEAVECQVEDLDTLQREAAEIDENICRENLSAAELAAALARKAELYAAVHGHPKSRAAHAANAAMGRSARANLAPAFAKVAADVTGFSPRTVQRVVSRGQKLGSDTLKKVQGTSLDEGLELDALARLTSDEQQSLIERAAQGERVSAVAAAAGKSCCKVVRKRTSPVATDGLGKLQRAWRRAKQEVRAEFIAWLRAEEPGLLSPAMAAVASKSRKDGRGSPNRSKNNDLKVQEQEKGASKNSRH